MELTEEDKAYQAFKQQAMRYCSYQERIRAEIQSKLRAWGMRSETAIDSLIQELKKEDFLNEQRYIVAFIRGRFMNKKWGKRKIRYELMKKALSPALIQEGLNTIDNSDYLNMIRHLILEKARSVSVQNARSTHQKLMNFLCQKGYEPELIREIIQETSGSI